MPVKTSLVQVYRLPIVDYSGKQPWGDSDGRETSRKLDEVLRDRPEPIVNLDLEGVERMDTSWAREALANLVRQHQGKRWFFLSGIQNASIQENVDAAFARRELAAIHRRDEDYELLGVALPDHLIQTLDVVEKHGSATARQVCEIIRNLGLTACNNRLRDLCDYGVLMRLEGSAPSGGKEYSYVALR